MAVSRALFLGSMVAVAGVTLTQTTAAARATNTAAVETAAPAPMEEAPETGAVSPSALDAAAWENGTLGAVDPKVFSLALQAAQAAVTRADVAEPRTLTVIDFSRPSTEKRMWVYDLRSRALLFEELVSHGRGSGTQLATAFSNTPESNKSSLGLFRTGEVYVGKHGESLRLDGLERGINDRARARAIVIHGASYVSAAVASAQGYLGRSLGCPAVRPEITRELIDTVKGDGLLFAYYPDREWLASSTYLN